MPWEVWRPSAFGRALPQRGTIYGKIRLSRIAAWSKLDGLEHQDYKIGTYWGVAPLRGSPSLPSVLTLFLSPCVRMLTSVDRLLFVRGVPIFKELRDDFLVRLASIMDELSFPASHTIFTEGQEGRALYIVVSGQVSVHLRGQELAQLETGTCFGEMSLFDAEPRSASVTTLQPCDCLMLTQQQLYEAIDETPGIAVNIIRLLSRRLRESNKELNEKKQELKEFNRQQTLTYAPDPQFLPQDPPPRPVLEEQPVYGGDGGGFPYSTFPY